MMRKNWNGGSLHFFWANISKKDRSVKHYLKKRRKQKYVIFSE